MSEAKDKILENIENEIKTLEEASIELKKSDSFFEVIMSIRNLNKLLNSNILLGLFFDEDSDDFFYKAEVSVKNGYLKFNYNNYCVKFSLSDKYIEMSRSKRNNMPSPMPKEDYERNILIIEEFKLNQMKSNLVVSEYKKQDSVGFFDKIFLNKNKIEKFISTLEENVKSHLINAEIYERMIKAYNENKLEDEKFLSSVTDEINVFLENGWELDSYGIELQEDR